MERLLATEAFPAPCDALHAHKHFYEALGNLLTAKRDSSLTAESGGKELDAFVSFFSDPTAVRQRVIACLQDHQQQPAPPTKADGLDLEPTWLDFLVADVTWKQPGDGARGDERPTDKQPAIRVPPWQDTRSLPKTGEDSIRGGDPTAV